MKILAIATLNLEASNGGTIHFTSICRGFRRMGCRVDALIPRLRHGESSAALADSFDRILEYSNWPVRLIRKSKTSINSISLLLKLVGLPLAGYDWVYLRGNLLSSPVTAMLRLRRARVAVEHNGWFAAELASMGATSSAWQRLVRLGQTFDAKMAHAVRVVVPGIRDQLTATGVAQEKMFVVGNGTDPGIFFPMQRDEALSKAGLALGRTYLGFIGDLEPWQGVETAIQAMPLIRRALPNAHLLIIGGGRCHADMLDRYGTHIDDVTFLGSVPYRESNLYINCFDLALIPKQGLSTIGYSPIKLYAYAAAGRPILASNITGLSELAGSGFLVCHQPGDVTDFAEKAVRLLSDPDTLQAMQKIARDHALQHFTWDSRAQEIITRLRTFSDTGNE
jgi:glycosyltransferase involved in cell wall biosynthesis